MENMTPESIFKIVMAIFFAGAVWGELKAIRKDITRLEKKQDETNRVKLRTERLEAISEMREKELHEIKVVLYGRKDISEE